jgi:DNA-binding GntR family transcriptional regulator
VSEHPTPGNLGQRAAFGTPDTIAVPSNTKSEAAYQMLKQWVIEGTLPPGHPLEQAALAQMVGVSLTPLREAIRRLEGEGLLQVAPHREVLVVPMTREDLHDIYESRLALEPFATRLAAQRATPQQRADLTNYLTPEPDTLELGPRGSRERIRRRYQIHRAIYAACGNATITTMLDMVWDRHDRYSVMMRHATQTNPNYLDGISLEHHDHIRLVDAVINGRAHEAENHVRNEVKRSLAWLRHHTEFLANH